MLPIPKEIMDLPEEERNKHLKKIGELHKRKINNMKITKDKKNLIVQMNKKDVWKIPLYQKSFDAAGEEQGEISNVVGMIDGNDIGFADVIDLGYKGSFDYGDFIVKLDINKKKFKKLCRELDLVCFEYPICVKCGEVIYGSHTWNHGPACFDCEDK